MRPCGHQEGVDGSTQDADHSRRARRVRSPGQSRAWGRPGVRVALVFSRALPSRTRRWFHRIGSPVRRANYDRLRQLALGFFLSAGLGLLAPAAAEAMSGIESLEDGLHHAGARSRAHLVRLEVSAARPARPVRALTLRQSPRATKEPSGRPAAGARVRKIPPSTPDSPDALPDH